MDGNGATGSLDRRALLRQGAGLVDGGALLGSPLVEQALARVGASGTKLEVWTWQATGGYPKVFDTVGKDYGKKFEGGSASFKTFPYADYFTKFKTASAGGHVPDMLEMDWSGSYHDAVDAKTLTALDTALKKGFPTFYKTAMDQMRYQGKVYGIPMDLNTLTIAYNKDLFKKLGLKVPKTLDELIALAKPIRDAGYQPMSVNVKDGWPNGDLFLAQLAYTDPSHTLIRRAEAGKAPWTSKPFLQAATNVSKMQEAGLFSDGSPSFGFVDAYTEFATGKSLMCYPVGNFGTPVIDSISKGKISYDLFAFPPMKAGVTPVATGGAAIIWSVPAKAKNPDAALDLARVFSGPFGTKTLVKANYIPAFKTSISNPSPIYKRMVSFQATAQTRSLFLPKVNAALVNGMQAISGGSGSPDKVVADLAKAAK